MEYIVTLIHADGSEVRTAYPASQQADAIAHWQTYVEFGKTATLSVER